MKSYSISETLLHSEKNLFETSILVDMGDGSAPIYYATIYGTTEKESRDRAISFRNILNCAINL